MNETSDKYTSTPQEISDNKQLLIHRSQNIRK